MAFYRSHVHLYHGIGTADNQHQQVRNAQVQQEQVGGGPHGLGGQYHNQNENIAYHSNCQNQTGGKNYYFSHISNINSGTVV